MGLVEDNPGVVEENSDQPDSQSDLPTRQRVRKPARHKLLVHHVNVTPMVEVPSARCGNPKIPLGLLLPLHVLGSGIWRKSSADQIHDSIRLEGDGREWHLGWSLVLLATPFVWTVVESLEEIHGERRSREIQLHQAGCVRALDEVGETELGGRQCDVLEARLLFAAGAGSFLVVSPSTSPEAVIWVLTWDPTVSSSMVKRPPVLSGSSGTASFFLRLCSATSFFLAKR